MKLPNGENALVEDAKLLDYVLNPAHPVGRHHAKLFEELLAITRENVGVLKAALLQAAVSAQVFRETATPFGVKYVQRFSMNGPAGAKAVLAVWIIDSGSERPRLVTCFVE